MNFENFENNQNATQYIHFFTNQFYSFAVASERVWSVIENVEHMATGQPFYQLMPVTTDDGFFDWCCYVRPNNQFFKTKEMCVLYFIKYWSEWSKNGKPDWQAAVN